MWISKIKKQQNQKNKKKFRKAGLIIVLLLIAAVAGALLFYSKQTKSVGAKASFVKTATVEKLTITSKLSSSGTISPKDTYEITSLAEGEVIAADFEEGDQVEKGQVLYRIDTSSMESELNSANNSLSRAQSSYQTAMEDYQEVLNDYSGNTYKSTEAGYIKTLSIKSGDKVSSNTKLADIYDDRTMKLRLPFLSTDAAGITVGNESVVTLVETSEQLSGIVTAVSNMEETLSGGRLVRYVTIQVSNPGGLTSNMAATASVGDFLCNMEANFEPSVDTVMSAELSGSVQISSLLVSEGDYITKGSSLFVMDGKSVEKLIRTYKDSLDKAEDSLESAQNKLESAQDTYDNYIITAPISGQVITKNSKAGDKITKNTNGSTALAVIYDMSSYTFEMSVDELDVKNVKVGQSVEITADAVSGKTFTGTVTNVSLESSYANGVTNYPVTVTLEDGTDELLPGMNVDGVIILDQVSDVLAVPADALMRGNRVYVRDDSVKEAQGSVPAGFRAVEVETGLISDSYVEIKSGLSEGDEVYIAQSSVSSETTMMMPGMPGGGGMSPGGGGSLGEGHSRDGFFGGGR